MGRPGFVVIAGPCAVESREGLLATAHAAREAGAAMLRGGAFKPRTSPRSFQGLGRDGLAFLAEARVATGLPIVTELLDVRHADDVAEVADVVQIGARNMAHPPLLREAAQTGLPVLLKRGFGATLEELLDAAEYVLAEGNDHVILVERGIRTFGDATRFTLDLAAVPVLRSRTHLPIIVDPSHAAGDARWVPDLARAAAAVGADGIMVESHHAPSEARSDGAQALTHGELAELVATIDPILAAVGRVRRTPGAPLPAPTAGVGDPVGA